MTQAFVFPGQGSQTVGMGLALARRYPAARQVFEAVDDALGEPLSALVFEGPEERLRLTENAQPALMACSIAALHALQDESGRSLPELADMVAGHSLGEYSALAAAGALDIADAARLLRLRGRAMQRAVPVGEGAMAAILGLDLGAVEEVAAEASANGICDIANDNAPSQVVVSGDRVAVEQALAIAKSRGARRSSLLPVSAPFHCRLMAPAAAELQNGLAAITLRVPTVPIVANVSAAPVRDPEELRAGLVAQVTARVRWRESLMAMGELDVESIVEVGAGKVLTGIAKRVLGTVKVGTVGTPEDVEAMTKALASG